MIQLLESVFEKKLEYPDPTLAVDGEELYAIVYDPYEFEVYNVAQFGVV